MPAFFPSIRMKDPRENSGRLKESVQNIADHVSDLLDSYYKLGVLNIADKATGIASLTVTIFVISLLCLFALLFICFGLAWWLGETMNNMFAGFTIIAIFFILLIGLIMAFRKQVLFPFIRNIIIRKVYE